MHFAIEPPRYDKRMSWIFWALLSAAPFVDEEQGFSGSMAMFTDITQRKHAEDELRQRNEELERFERLVVGRELKMKTLKGRIAELEGAERDGRREEPL